MSGGAERSRKVPLQGGSRLGRLRGALALALALAVPQTVPERLQIIVTVFAVGAFSVFVQGLTIPPLLRRLGLLAAKT